jgi:cis-3-alkyl-4-acyloxetan-2-one decarboxylase
MKILVTGSTSSLGERICLELHKKNHQIIGFSRNDNNTLKGINQIRGNIINIQQLLIASYKCDAIIHIAAKVGIEGNFMEFYNTNVIGTRNIIEVCKYNSIKYLLYASSPSVVAGKNDCYNIIEGNEENTFYRKNHISYYTRTKKIAEKLLLQTINHETCLTILRPHLIWSDYLQDKSLTRKIIDKSIQNKLVNIQTFSDKKRYVSILHLQDAVESFVRTLDCMVNKPNIMNKQVMFISHPEKIETPIFIQNLITAHNYDKKRKIPTVPFFLAYGIGYISEILYGSKTSINRWSIVNLSTSHHFDCSLFYKTVGYIPKINSVNGLNNIENKITKDDRVLHNLGYNYKDLYPFNVLKTTINGYQMAYIDEIPKNKDKYINKTYLLIHGNPSWSFMFRKLIVQLKKKYRVIAIDHIGCGNSDKPYYYNYSLTQHIENLSSFITKLQLSNIYLVVHDWGGPIGTGCFLNNKSLFKEIIYLNTSIFRNNIPLSIKVCKIPIIGSIINYNLGLFNLLATYFTTFNKMLPAIKQGYLFPYQHRYNRVAINSFVQDIPFTNYSKSGKILTSISKQMETIKNINIKILWGMKDWCFHSGFLNKMHLKYFPKATVKYYHKSGHYLLEDQFNTICSDIINDDNEMPINVTNLLSKYSEKFPNKMAIIDEIHNIKLSYQDLNNQVNYASHYYTCKGVKKYDKIAIFVKPGFKHFVTFFSILRIGAIPVLIDPNMGIFNIIKCLKNASISGIIGEKIINLSAQVLHYIYLNVSLIINVYCEQECKNLCLSDKSVETPEDVILLVFTTGSTGNPKAVSYTYQNFISICKKVRSVLPLKSEDYIASTLIVFSYFIFLLGNTLVLPNIDYYNFSKIKPHQIVNLSKRYPNCSLYASPIVWKNFVKSKYSASFKSILIAGAPVYIELINQIEKKCLNCNITVLYGCTEFLPVSSINNQQMKLLNDTKKMYRNNRNEGDDILENNLSFLCNGNCVGKKTDGNLWKIVSFFCLDNGGIKELKPFQLGELIVTGNQLSRYYKYNRYSEKNNKNNKNNSIIYNGQIWDKTTGTFWLRIGDIGYLDDQDNFWYCGRKADMFIYKHFYVAPIVYEKYFTNITLCAIVFNKHPFLVIEDNKEKVLEKIKQLNDPFLNQIKVVVFSEHISYFKYYFANSSLYNYLDKRHNSKILRRKIKQVI